jgi:hypothetical protein
VRGRLFSHPDKPLLKIKLTLSLSSLMRPDGVQGLRLLAAGGRRVRLRLHQVSRAQHLQLHRAEVEEAVAHETGVAHLAAEEAEGLHPAGGREAGGRKLMVWGAAVQEDCVVVEREGYVG